MTVSTLPTSPFSALGGIPGVSSACVLKLPPGSGPAELEELYSFGKAFDEGRDGKARRGGEREPVCHASRCLPH